MKIWSKLFLVAATGMMMFSSCLENIEPEGIKDLRGAKAELLRAQTALAEANAAKVNADAAIALAKAKVEEAIAKQEEAKAAYEAAKARLKELEVEKQTALDKIEIDKAIAEAKAAIADAEARAAVYAAELERDLINVQTEIVNAQAAYERALKDLAVAKVSLTRSQMRYLRPFWAAVTEAENNVETATTNFESASESLANAMKFIEDNKKFAVRWGEKEVAKAEAALEGALEAVEIAEAALKIDTTIVDWVELRAELEAEKKAIEDKGMASYVGGEYAELKKALYGVETTQGGVTTVEEEGLIHKAKEYTDYTGMTFDEETGKFVEPVFPVDPTSTTAMEYPAVYVAAPVDAEGNPVGEDFTLNEYTTPEEGTPSTTAGGEGETPKMYYGDASEVLAVFDEAIEGFEKLTSTKYYDYQKMVYEAQLKGIEEDEENVAAFEKYEDAVAAYKAGDPTQYYKAADEDYDIETPVAEYNAALKAMVAALNTYNAESKKYEDADNTEAEEAAKKLYDDAKAKAFATYVGKKQTALDKYNEAKVTYNKASLAYERATRSYNAVLDAAIDAVGAIEGDYKVTTDSENVATDLTKAIEDYNKAKTEFVATEETPKFDADGKWTAAVAIYTAELTKVNDAQKLYKDTDVTNKTDADSVWEAAKEAYAKAGDDDYTDNTNGDYYKAVTAAWNEYVAVAGDGEEEGVKGDEIGSAWQAYQDTLDDLGVGATGMDTDYKGYLWKNYTDAVDALVDAIGYVVADAIKTGEAVEVVMGDEDYLSFKYVDENYELVDPMFPDYLVDEETQALKEIKVADVVDKEYFLATTVKELADDLAAFAKFDYNVDGEDYDLYVVAGKPADYPASLPTYEAIIEEIAAVEGGIDQYATEVAIRELAETGVFVDAQNTTITFVNSPLVQGGSIKYQMAQNEAARANTAVAADHIKVLEAAKAEFEAYVAEAEKAVDAIRTEVEAAWAEVYPKYAELEEARVTTMARYAEVKATITRITNAVNLYIFNNLPAEDEDDADDDATPAATTPAAPVVPELPDYDAFVEALQTAYDKAVEAADDAEFNLENTKEMLENIKNDKVAWLEAVQKAFDDAKADLEEAMAELAEAAAALEEAMEAIGEGKAEAEETPAE